MISCIMFPQKDVTKNCSVEGTRQSDIVCSLWIPYDSYLMRLQHLASWTTGSLFESIRIREYSFGELIFFETFFLTGLVCYIAIKS